MKPLDLQVGASFVSRLAQLTTSSFSRSLLARDAAAIENGLAIDCEYYAEASMPDADQFRDRATRLLKIAIMAEDGQLAYAQELTRLAAEALDEATQLEREQPR
jgi:hypothetical protein